MKNKVQKITVYVVPLMIIMFFVLKYMDMNHYPKIFGDEYGYWSAGAFFAGLDWNDITSMNEYYGWGYGLLLSLILRLPIAAKECYILAVALNGIMLWGCYCVAYELSKAFFTSKSVLFRSVVSLFSVAFPSSFYYTQYCLSEVILTFLYWLLVYAEWRLIDEFNIKNSVRVMLINIALFAVHMRSIGIVLVSVAIMFVYIVKRRDRRVTATTLIVMGVMLAIGFWAVLKVKDVFSSSMVLPYTQIKGANTIGGQIDKIEFLFSKRGFMSFLSNMYGRLFTLFSNTFLLAGYTLAAVLALVLRKWRLRKLENKDIFYIVVTVNVLFEMAISSLFMIGAEESRFDILIYSRYHEFSVGILVLIAFTFWCKDSLVYRMNKYLIIVVVLAELVLTKLVMNSINFSAPKTHLFFNTPSFCFWNVIANTTKEAFLLNVVAAISIFTLVVISLANKNSLFIVCSIVLSIFCAISIDYTLKEGCFNWSVVMADEYEKVYDFIKDNSFEQEVYFICDDNVLKVELLQFMLKNYDINVVTEDMLAESKNNKIALITSNEKREEIDGTFYIEELRGKYISLWCMNE